MWPEHCRAVVTLTFDVDAESDEIRTMPDKPVALSKGRYGMAVGIKRVLTLLDKENIKATFFVPGWVLENYPDVILKIKALGHEIASHGYLHEKLSELEPNEELNVLNRMISSFQRVLGYTPAGFRAPWWELSSRTFNYLRKLGVTYDSSLMSGDSPFFIEIDGEITDLVELPVDWSLDDWPLFEIHRKTPSEVYEIWWSEFDALYEEGAMFNLTMHPECIGRASRIRMLSQLIEAIKKKGNVWFARCIDVVERWRALQKR